MTQYVDIELSRWMFRIFFLILDTCMPGNIEDEWYSHNRSASNTMPRKWKIWKWHAFVGYTHTWILWFFWKMILMLLWHCISMAWFYRRFSASSTFNVFFSCSLFTLFWSKHWYALPFLFTGNSCFCISYGDAWASDFAWIRSPDHLWSTVPFPPRFSHVYHSCY